MPLRGNEKVETRWMDISDKKGDFLFNSLISRGRLFLKLKFKLHLGSRVKENHSLRSQRWEGGLVKLDIIIKAALKSEVSRGTNGPLKFTNRRPLLLQHLEKTRVEHNLHPRAVSYCSQMPSAKWLKTRSVVSETAGFQCTSENTDKWAVSGKIIFHFPSWCEELSSPGFTQSTRKCLDAKDI